MAYITTSSTIANGTTADATDVQGNFDNITNGLAGGLKDIKVAAATFTGGVQASSTVQADGAITAKASFVVETGATTMQVLVGDASGNATWDQVDTDGIAAGAITPAKMETCNNAFSSSCVQWSDNSGGWVAVSNLTTVFTGNGRPVMLTLQSDGDNDSFLGVDEAIGNNVKGAIRFLRNGTSISRHIIQNDDTGTANDLKVPLGITHIDNPSSGVVTYTIEGIVANGDDIRVHYAKLAVVEF